MCLFTNLRIPCPPPHPLSPCFIEESACASVSLRISFSLSVSFWRYLSFSLDYYSFFFLSLSLFLSHVWFPLLYLTLVYRWGVQLHAPQVALIISHHERPWGRGQLVGPFSVLSTLFPHLSHTGPV